MENCNAKIEREIFQTVCNWSLREISNNSNFEVINISTLVVFKTTNFTYPQVSTYIGIHKTLHITLICFKRLKTTSITNDVKCLTGND